MEILVNYVQHCEIKKHIQYLFAVKIIVNGGIPMSRRGENIYKRKDGRWEGRYIKSRDAENKALYGYLYGKSYAEVKDKLKNIKIQDIHDNNKSVLFSEIAKEWYELKRLNVKESTLARYKSVLENHIIPLLGTYYISLISPKIIQDYLNQLKSKGFSAKTVNDVLIVIKNIFKFAELKGIRINVALNTITVKQMKNRIETLTALDENKLRHYLLEHMDNKNLGILLCLFTGIRIGELCALKWSDIDIKEKIISIDKTMIRIQRTLDCKMSKTKVVITSPKSEDSKRIIPISDSLIKILGSFKQNKTAYILTGFVDKYIEPRNMQYHFKSVLKKCGIKNYKFHTLRHTFATRCVENGFEIKSLSEILGHSSIKITLDRYVHTSIDLKRKEMEKLNFLSA